MSSDRYRTTQGGFDVVFSYAILGVRAAPGPLLTAVLGELGYQESAARNQVIRLVNRGLVNARKAGRYTVYTLGEVIAGRLHAISASGRAAPWSGSYRTLVYDIPETERTVRDRVRYIAGHFGYGTLRPGLMIAAGPQASPVQAVGPMPPGTLLEEGTLTPDDHASALRMAERSWALSTLNADYDRVARLIEDTLSTGLPDGAPGVRGWRDLYVQIAGTRLADPSLPAELLPPRWAGERAVHLQAEFDGRHGPGVRSALWDRAVDPAWAHLVQINPDAYPPHPPDQSGVTGRSG